MNKKEWKDYINQVFVIHLTLGGSEKTFPKVLTNMGICTTCIRNKDKCECAEASQ